MLELCREHGMSLASLYKCRSKYGGWHKRQSERVESESAAYVRLSRLARPAIAYKAKLSEDHERVRGLMNSADREPMQLGLWSFLPVSAQCQKIRLEPQARLSDISRAGVEFADHTKKAAYPGKARIIVGANADQRRLDNGFHARPAVELARHPSIQPD